MILNTFIVCIITSLTLCLKQNNAINNIIDEDANYLQPEQVHIAFGNKINDIMVTWSTMNDTTKTQVAYGEKEPLKKVDGSSKVFIDGGKEKRRQWIHRVLLKDLKFNTTYVYKVGSDQGWSQQFTFTTPPDGENNTVSVLLFGDLGVGNGRSIPFIINEIKHKRYDVGIHIGDLAYDLNTNNGRTGDKFMNMMEPFAANLPYMVGPGNHENYLNYSHIKKRYSMPGDFENMYYTFNIGPIHFISVNTEAYYNNSRYPADINKNKGEIVTQYNWLVQDLEEASKPENRKIRPWIIMVGHRTFYCSDSTVADQCVDHDFPHRIGIPKYGGLGLEPLFNKYGIDLGIWAHEHSYERLWPIYNRTVYNGSYEHPYVNPKAPVYVITGSAGNHEHQDHFVENPPDWSAFRSSDYSYTRLFSYNSSHLRMEQVFVSPVHDPLHPKSEKLVDSFWLVKDYHKPYGL